MTSFKTALAIAFATGAQLMAQQNMLAPLAFDGDIEQARAMAEQARAMADEARANAAEMKMNMAQGGLILATKGLNFNFDFDSLAHLKSDLAMLQQAPQPPQGPQPPMPPKGRIIYGRDSGNYDQGTRYLDDRKYDQAISVFDRQIAAKTERADGALYWKAYALNRLGRSDDALATIAALRRDYPSSRWLNDAQVLEAETKQNAGHPVSTDDTNDDIKLLAINSLMSADPDRAIPLLETLLKSSTSIRLKERAMFVLTQNRSPKAEQILTDYAKGAGNPDLQVRAIRYIGMSNTAESHQRLVTIYNSTNDAAVKSEIIRALMSSGGSDKLLELARSEKDANLRMTIIQNLAVTRGTNVESLVGLYSADNDQKTKRALVNGLHSRGDAKPLIELARKESDPTMKKYIVERLATMHDNKDATEYMLELLK